MSTTYPMREGRNGPIYQVAEGLFVSLTQFKTWQVYLNRGKRKKHNFGKTDEDREAAFRAAELLAAKLGFPLLKVVDNPNRTFGQMADQWFQDGQARWKAGTQVRYETIVRDNLQPLLPIPLAEVERGQIRRLLLELLRVRSANTVELVHAVISAIFSEAIEVGYLDRNPAYGLLKKILPAKAKRNLNPPDPFNRQDLDRFLVAAWDRLPETHALILEVMAMTGMRLGEAIAMSAENLDSHNCQYRVTQTFKVGFGEPKTGRRLIDLDSDLVEKLESHIRRLGKGRGRLSLLRHLFPGITQRMVQRAMQTACNAARLRMRHPHDLRHTYATLLLMEHISPAYVQKQLGHHSISMTVDIYGHWIPGEGRERLGNALRGEKPRKFTVVRDYMMVRDDDEKL